MNMQIKPSLPDANKIMGEKVNNDKTVQVSPAVAGTMLNKAIYARYPKKYFLLLFFFLFAFCLLNFSSSAQVNAVEFGKNRVQYKKFKWQYYQTKNFNVYFNQNGQELAKYIAQSAEKELPSIESAAEYSLQRRANIVLYNEFADMQQSNIGLGIDWQNTGGATKLVNNKMVVYFDADHAKLRKQIREGIARILTDNRLFGDDIGEFAGNQALLDLPKWLTDGYVAYLGENWSTELDDELKSEMLSGNYTKFYKFAFEKPQIAGHAFWYYIEERFKKENVTYLLYLATVYKNLNKACMQVCKKKFSEVLAEFMEYQDDKYSRDITRRISYPKGNYVDGFDISPRLNYYRFNVNPNKKNNSYVVTQYKKGIVRVILNDDFENKTLLKYGIRSWQNEVNPNYPLMAWDPKGTRICIVYTEEGRLKLFVYDLITNIKFPKLDLTDKFGQIQDMKYMLNSNTLLLSAVKNGHTDIFTFDINKEKVTQITNDVYDDLDAEYVSFPNKTGILFSSNRPGPDAKSGDTVLPSNNRYNIYLVTNFGDKPELNQITQLSNLKYGNARFPMPYNENHFTFASDENGVNNRYAGFFTTKKEGLDTLVLIAGEIFRNPSAKEVDSLLRAYKQTDIDSIAVVSITTDSAYTFPLSNYQSSLAETRVAGDTRQVSEVTRQSDEKILYKLKIDENTLRRRNITVPPTTYMKKIMEEDKVKSNAAGVMDIIKELSEEPKDTAKKEEDIFQVEFTPEKTDSNLIGKVFSAEAIQKNDVLSKAKIFPYKPKKFSVDYAGANAQSNTGGAVFGNQILATKYQPYGGPNQQGPIRLTGGSDVLSAMTKVGVSDLFEDIRISGAYQIGSGLDDYSAFMSYQNLKRRIDWGISYYRSVSNKVFTNLYQLNFSYPFDNAKSIRLMTGVRSDRDVYPSLDQASLVEPDIKTKYSLTHVEFVYDNSLNPAQNIWNGLRYKVFFDWNRQLNKNRFNDGPNTFNAGFDVRYYYPIFRNFIWAGRAAGDFSFGNQKMIYYLGGVDGWLMFGNNQKFDANNNLVKERYFNSSNTPANDQSYAFQSLALNMRGFIQNTANGNNALVINSEFRLPVFTTLFSRPINNAFLRNFQLVQFVDLGTAWNGNYNSIARPSVSYGTPPIVVKVKAGGVGPFAGGYGFGARSTLLGYFVKFDAAWQMSGIFKGKPQLYVALGLDF